MNRDADSSCLPPVEFGIDGKTLGKLAELGVEKKEDMAYLTEEVIPFYVPFRIMPLARVDMLGHR